MSYTNIQDNEHITTGVELVSDAISGYGDN